jgi:serine/threonine protein kinase
MDSLDGATFGKQAVRLGLLSEQTLRETFEELGSCNPPLDDLIPLLERKGLLTPWQTARVRDGKTEGYFLGGYRLLYKVASGTFGRVYRAEDPETGRQIAVKVLRRKWSEDQGTIDQFVREGKLGLTLHHANIVEVLAISHDPGSDQHFIAMEFVEGGNLREWLKIRKRLTVPEALKVLEECASGLDYSFSTHRLTHRDMKLTNVLLSANKETKLVDFGLAQLYAGEKEIDKTVRTVDYNGLERATGVKLGDLRSDIYFLGGIFYEMLSGRSPWPRTRSKAARMQRSRFEEVVPLSRADVDAPRSVFSLLDTMMSLDPMRRYQTFSQLLQAVRAVRRDVEGGQDGPPAPRTLFIVEKDPRLQLKMRDIFRELGYKVLMSFDPTRAVQQFRQRAYDAVMIDAAGIGAEARTAFQQLQSQAERENLAFAGVIVLDPEQAGWAEALSAYPRAAVLVRPGVTHKQVHRAIQELLRKAGSGSGPVRSVK